MASQARREGEDIIAKSHRIIAERNAAKEAAFAENLVTPSNNVNNADVLKNEIIPVDGETGGSSSKRVQSPQITQEISDDSSSSDFSSFNDDDYDDSSGDDNSSGENDYSGDNNYSNEDDGGDNNDDNNDNNDLNDRDSLNDLFPMARDANVITKQVQKFLKAAYRRDSRSWTQEMTKRFREVAPTLNYEICSSTGGKISAHYICKRAKGERAKLDGNIWVHFWFLRVMFGPIACSRQPWFAELAAECPWVLDEADEGVVPKDTAFILWSKTTTWTPKILQKETPTLKKRESEKRKAAEPMKPSRPTKGTKVSRSHNNQDPREISRPRTRTRASINRQNYRNASHSTYEISQSSNEVSQSRDEQNPQNIEAMAPSSNDQQEFNLPSELEIKLLKQKYGAMRSTCDTFEHRIAQLESENSLLKQEHGTLKQEHGTLKQEHGTLKQEHGTLKQEHGTLKQEHGTLKQEHGTLRSTCNTLEQRTRQLENGNRELKRESERENERLREEFNTFKLEHAWKVDHLWKRMNQLEQNLPGKE